MKKFQKQSYICPEICLCNKILHIKFWLVNKRSSVTWEVMEFFCFWGALLLNHYLTKPFYLKFL